MFYALCASVPLAVSTGANLRWCRGRGDVNTHLPPVRVDAVVCGDGDAFWKRCAPWIRLTQTAKPSLSPSTSKATFRVYCLRQAQSSPGLTLGSLARCHKGMHCDACSNSVLV